MTTPIFELRNISYSFPEARALDGITFSIGQRERIALLGTNGSGKSTLLKILAGLIFPSGGSITFDGAPMTEPALDDATFARPFRRRVGMIFQNPDIQLFCPTVFDEIAFGPLQLGWSKEEILTRVDEQLLHFDIAHLKSRSPHRLSGGEKKRVALAATLIMDPEILLIDEPTAALDPKSQSRIIDFLFGCAGVKTVVTATHDLALLEDIADRCLVLSNGRLFADAAPLTLLNNFDLLEHTGLVLAHRHRHPSGEVHSHPLLPGSHSHLHQP